MSWFSGIFGNGVGRTVDSIGGLAKVVIGDKSAREAGYHAENMATKSQYAAEFQYRGNTDWVDKWNRIPRPLLVTTILSFFPFSIYMVFKHPVEYKLLMEALALIPNGAWILLSTVIGFYFGGRMQIKSQDFTISKEQINRFKESYDEYMSDKEIANTPDTDQFEEHGDK